MTVGVFGSTIANVDHIPTCAVLGSISPLWIELHAKHRLHVRLSARGAISGGIQKSARGAGIFVAGRLGSLDNL
jgi:hypothetical protein